MKTILPICLVTLAFTSLQAQEPEIKLIPVSLELVEQPIPLTLFEQKKPGITLTLQCEIEDGGIISAEQSSKLADEYDLEVTDSTGKNLGDLEISEKNAFLGMGSLLRNRRYQFKLPVLPSPESQSIIVKGTLPVKIHYGRTKNKPFMLDFKEGEHVTAEGISIKINKAQETTLSIKITGKTEEFPFELTFCDEEGKEIKTETRGYFSRDSNIDRTYSLDRKIDKIGIIVSVWKKSKRVDIPVDFKFGLGEPIPQSEPKAQPTEK